MNSTEWLKRDHELILEALDLLHAIADRVAAGAPIPASVAHDLIDFFRSFADSYHHLKEETSLFPVLESAGLMAPVSVMLHEHEEGRDLLRSLEKAFTGPSAASLDADGVRHIAAMYTNLLRDHIHKENEVLFRMADRVLMPSEDEDISATFAALDVGKPLGGLFAVYRRRVDDLRAWLAAAPPA